MQRRTEVMAFTGIDLYTFNLTHQRVCDASADLAVATRLKLIDHHNTRLAALRLGKQVLHNATEEKPALSAIWGIYSYCGTNTVKRHADGKITFRE